VYSISSRAHFRRISREAERDFVLAWRDPVSDEPKPGPEIEPDAAGNDVVDHPEGSAERDATSAAPLEDSARTLPTREVPPLEAAIEAPLPEEPRDAPLPKKKKRKRKKRAEAESAKAETPAAMADLGTDTLRRRERRNTLIWVSALGTLFTVELVVFGYNGYVDVCVGREGVTDFALSNRAAGTDDAQKMPLCQRRHNLGMQSRYDEEAKAGLRQACQRASAMFGTRDWSSCVSGSGGWTRRITGHQVPPWHEPFYREMLWFLF
jgi:hypothetical protein